MPFYAAMVKLLPQQGSDELVPLLHPGALLGHVGPAVVVLGTHVLQGVILDAVADFLRTPALPASVFQVRRRSRLVTTGITSRSRWRYMKLYSVSALTGFEGSIAEGRTSRTRSE